MNFINNLNSTTNYNIYCLTLNKSHVCNWLQKVKLTLIFWTKGNF